MATEEGFARRSARKRAQFRTYDLEGGNVRVLQIVGGIGPNFCFELSDACSQIVDKVSTVHVDLRSAVELDQRSLDAILLQRNKLRQRCVSVKIVNCKQGLVSLLPMDRLRALIREG